MNSGIRQFIFDGVLTWLCMANLTAGITLTVIPSNVVEVNQSVTLQCELDPDPIPPILAIFYVQSTSSTLCALEPNNGVCKNTPDTCRTRYNASCPSNTRYSIQVTIPRDWNGVSVVCQTAYGQTNSIVFSVKVPVTSVTLTPTTIAVIGGHLINLTCTTSYSNPAANITWYKSSLDITSQSTSTTEKDGDFLKTLSILQSSVFKEDNGKQVFCRASNTPDKSVTSSTKTLNVMYKPEVTSPSQSPYKVRERETATLKCAVIDANPNTSITWRWFKTDSPNTVLYNGPTYTIPSITRGRSGSYSCTASNSIGTSEAATMDVDVLYKPSIEEKDVMIVNETERVVLTREISSNPLSNVSWYDGTQLLKSQTSVQITNFIIERARCNDTKKLTLVASNSLEWKTTSLVELIVNCKPSALEKKKTLWVSNTTGIEFSTSVIAYPRPNFTLEYENGTENKQMMNSLARNAVNNFTIHYNLSVVMPSDYGTYYLRVSNSFGNTTVFVNVIRQQKPHSPTYVNVTCEVTSAKVQWKSSFNGGDPQTFTVFTVDSQQRTLLSKGLPDNGENKSHITYIRNLQPSMTYVFYVSAINSHGNSLSEFRICTTSEEIKDHIPVVAGSIGGTLVLVTIILAILFFMHRRYMCKCTISLEKRNRDEAVKENDEAAHYTTVAEQEQADRNMYDELIKHDNVNQYEAVLMKEREENNEKMYEKLQKTHNSEKKVPFDDQRNVVQTKDASTQLPNLLMTGATDEYTNTAFVE